MTLWRLARWQARAHCGAPLLAALGLLAALPLAFGTHDLPAAECARLLEGYFPLCGVPLLAGLFAPEARRGLRDCVAARRAPYLFCCALRAGWRLAAAGVLAGGFSLWLALRGCAVWPGHAFAAFAGAVFLGGLALLGSVLLGGVTAGTVPVLGWLAADLLAGRLGPFSLLRLSGGQGLPKPGLLALGLALLAVAFAVRRRQLLAG